jgi:hypothetical protein
MGQDRTPPTSDEQDPAAVTTDDSEFGNEHPLSSPSELAGTADGAIAAEFAARDAMEGESDPLADASGSAIGATYEQDTLPLEGE